MKIVAREIKGFNKKGAPHLIDSQYGQQAVNTRHDRGDIRGIRKPDLVQQLSTTGNKTLYQYVEGTSKHWVTSTYDLDFVRTPIANDSFERVYFTGLSEPRVLAKDKVSTPFDFSTDYYKLGVKVPTAAPTFVSGHTGGSNYRAYVFTYVSRYGEEGPPSPVLATTTYNSGSVVLSGFTDPSDEHLKTTIGANRPKIRLYRTASSTAGVAAFQFVKEVYADTFTWGTGQITDDVTTLGEVIPSVDWYPPPAGLKGLNVLPNGFLVGFTGNALYFSEPYLPSAWNPDYEISFSEVIIAIGVFGTNVAVLTDEGVYLVYGTHPSTMTKQRLPGYYPCFGKRAVVSFKGGVIFPSREGFMLVNQNGVENITQDLLTSEEMAGYYTENMVSCYWDGMYLGFFTSPSTSGGIIIDLEEGSLSDLNITMSALHPSFQDNALYLIGTTGGTTEYIQEWEGDEYNYLPYRWRSKKFLMPSDINISTARVIIDQDFYTTVLELISENDYLIDLNETLISGEIYGAFNTLPLNEGSFNGSILYSIQNISLDPTINFKLYVDNELKFVKAVSNNRIFRLPAGFRGKVWEFQIDGYLPVREVALGSSVREVMSSG